MLKCRLNIFRTESEATDSIKHSTPNPLMDRVLDVSFDTIQSHVNLLQQGSNPDNIDNNVVGNRNMIKDIADGNVTFRFVNSSNFFTLLCDSVLGNYYRLSTKGNYDPNFRFHNQTLSQIEQ